jgi:hypothetical protein
MKNERATVQFQCDSCISHNELWAVRLMNIHRAQIETRPCILAQVPPERLRANRVVVKLQPDDDDDLPNLQRSARIAPLEKDRLLYKEFDTLDGALAWARHVNDGGRVALLIEGDDGTHIGKQEIAGALHHGEAPPR